MISAASRVGDASHAVLSNLGEEDAVDREVQDILLGLAKAVANTTAALVLQSKSVAANCPDQATQNRVIAAATQCALATSQLVACAKVSTPPQSIKHPHCFLPETSSSVSTSIFTVPAIDEVKHYQFTYLFILITYLLLIITGTLLYFPHYRPFTYFQLTYLLFFHLFVNTYYLFITYTYFYLLTITY